MPTVADLFRTEEEEIETRPVSMLFRADDKGFQPDRLKPPPVLGSPSFFGKQPSPVAEPAPKISLGETLSEVSESITPAAVATYVQGILHPEMPVTALPAMVPKMTREETAATPGGKTAQFAVDALKFPTIDLAAFAGHIADAVGAVQVDGDTEPLKTLIGGMAQDLAKVRLLTETAQYQFAKKTLGDKWPAKGFFKAVDFMVEHGLWTKPTAKEKEEMAHERETNLFWNAAGRGLVVAGLAKGGAKKLAKIENLFKKDKGRAPEPLQPFAEQVTPELEAKMREVSLKPKEAPDALQKAQAPKPKAEEVAKQSWEMTREEYISHKFDITDNKVLGFRTLTDKATNKILEQGKGRDATHNRRINTRIDTERLNDIYRAIEKGENVPASILADVNIAKKALPKMAKKGVLVSEYERVLAEYPELGKAKPPKPLTTQGKGEKGAVELGLMGTPEAYKQLGESVVSGARKVAEVANEIVKSAKVPDEVRPGLKVAKEAMIEHHTKIREPELLTYLFEHEFKKAVPDKARQELILHSLQQRRKNKGYTELTPQEQGVLKWVELEADRLAKYVKDNKILVEGITDQFEKRGHRYLFQWWRDPTGKARQSKYGKFAKTAPQFKGRDPKYPTYEAGMKLGLEPVTTNVGRIIGESWQAVVRAHESQQMHNSMAKINVLDANMQMKRSKGGQQKPARFIEKWADLEEAGLADEYVRQVDHFWNKATTYIPAEGAKPAKFSYEAIGIHKQLYPFWKAYKDSPTYGNFAKFVFTTKSMKLLSFFHPAQLGLNQAATGRVPFTGIVKGKKLWKTGNETIRLLHKHGLEMPGRYEDINYGDLYKFKGNTVAGKVGNALLKPVEWNAKLIFNHIQPGMKTAFAYGKFNKLWPKYQKKGLSMDRCARDVVKAADNFFSGEDYKRAMLETNKFMARYYFSAGARKGWQMSLISPTWQRENIILVKNVLKSMIPEPLVEKMGLQTLGPSASIYRRYAGAAVGLYGIANLYNWMATKEMDGKGVMMHENAKPFGVRMLWNSPAYTTTDKNGKERKHPGGKPVFWRPFKTIVEVPEFFLGEQDRGKGVISNVATSMVKKTGYKLAPWLSATAKFFLGYQYQNPSAVKRAKDWAINVFAPISAMQASDWVTGKKNPQDALGAFFGMPSGTISVTEFKRIFYERWGYALIAKDEDEAKLVIKQWNELELGKFNRVKAIDIKNEILREQEEDL